MFRKWLGGRPSFYRLTGCLCGMDEQVGPSIIGSDQQCEYNDTGEEP